MTSLPQRTIGPWSVSAVGLGCMPLSFTEMVPHREQAIATIHRALDLGITMLDTANIYAPSWDAVGHNVDPLFSPSILKPSGHAFRDGDEPAGFVEHRSVFCIADRSELCTHFCKPVRDGDVAHAFNCSLLCG